MKQKIHWVGLPADHRWQKKGSVKYNIDKRNYPIWTTEKKMKTEETPNIHITGILDKIKIKSWKQSEEKKKTLKNCWKPKMKMSWRQRKTKKEYRKGIPPQNEDKIDIFRKRKAENLFSLHHCTVKEWH